MNQIAPVNNEITLNTETSPFGQKSTDQLSGLSDSAKGAIYCLLSDVLFSFSFFFVRVLTTYGEAVHRDWIFCIKEAITATGALPIFLYFWYRGKSVLPSIKVIALILVAAFFCELVGARSHISTFASMGIILGNPLIRTFTILGTAIIGFIFLRERLSPLKLATMAVLIGAVFILGFSQSKGQNLLATAPTIMGSESVVIPSVLLPVIERIRELCQGMGVELTPLFVFGLGMAFMTGLGYALYFILLRYILRKAKKDDETFGKENTPVPIFFIVAVICGFGAVVGAIFLYQDQGWNGFIDVPNRCWLFAGLAGGLNVICFFLKNLALRYATASKVAIFSVLQIFLATLLGIIFFKEPTNAIMYAGLAITILGIAMAAKTN